MTNMEEILLVGPSDNDINIKTIGTNAFWFVTVNEGGEISPLFIDNKIGPLFRSEERAVKWIMS